MGDSPPGLDLERVLPWFREQVEPAPVELAVAFRLELPQLLALPVRVEHGDVVVWGGPARLSYHGVLPLADAQNPLTGPLRINLTFRKAL